MSNRSSSSFLHFSSNCGRGSSHVDETTFYKDIKTGDSAKTSSPHNMNTHTVPIDVHTKSVQSSKRAEMPEVEIQTIQEEPAQSLQKKSSLLTIFTKKPRTGDDSLMNPSKFQLDQGASAPSQSLDLSMCPAQVMVNVDIEIEAHLTPQQEYVWFGKVIIDALHALCLGTNVPSHFLIHLGLELTKTLHSSSFRIEETIFGTAPRIRSFAEFRAFTCYPAISVHQSLYTNSLREHSLFVGCNNVHLFLNLDIKIKVSKFDLRLRDQALLNEYRQLLFIPPSVLSKAPVTVPGKREINPVYILRRMLLNSGELPKVKETIPKQQPFWKKLTKKEETSREEGNLSIVKSDLFLSSYKNK